MTTDKLNTVVQVAVPIRLRKVLDYQLPEGYSSLAEGTRVRITVKLREMTGIVVGSKKSELPEEGLIRVVRVLDESPCIPPSLLKLLRWSSSYYHHPLGEVIQTALPSILRGDSKIKPDLPFRYYLTSNGAEALNGIPKNATNQRLLLTELSKASPDGLSSSTLSKLAPSSSTKLLRDRGWINVREDSRDFLYVGQEQDSAAIALNQSQRSAVSEISVALQRYQPFLLQGVTGSGKTEIYLELATRVIKTGCQVLLLVPEIALTPQLIGRFKRGLNGKIAVLHSRLSNKDRHIAWWAAREGIADVILGTRSAVFVPLARPGMYIVDEEHDSAYKQQEGFRYNARDLIVKRAQQDDIPAVLGSATPSLESMQNAKIGRYGHLVLRDRARGAMMPKISLLNVKQLPLTFGISSPVLEALRLRLDRGEQSIVYINRRGFSPILWCPKCNWRARCSRCDVYLTLHRPSNQLRCHHCGASNKPSENCPDCKHISLKAVGQGTQRVEETLQKYLPSARIVRFDSDSIGKANVLAERLAQVLEGNVDILVGTQLLAKGHNFPAVTLVCIVDADSGLYSFDFRAVERLYQTLTQVAGRAGRASRSGQVLVQTQYPENSAFSRLMENDFSGFVDFELKQRQLANCPPFVRFVLLRAESVSSDSSIRFVTAAAQLGQQILRKQSSSIRLMDPVPSPMERRSGRYRAQLLVTGCVETALHRFLDNWLNELDKLEIGRRVRWSLDVDPLDIY